jgi:glutamate--cysteine ligase
LVQELLHKGILENRDKVQDWFQEQAKGLNFPFYSSFDIRDAGFKIAPVDANIFPAGFNNICGNDKESAVEIAKHYLDIHYESSSKKIVLLTEENFKNPYYWDNVWTLKKILEEAERDVKIAIPTEIAQPMSVTSATGQTFEVFGAKRDGGGLNVDGFVPDLIINNNDFSVENMEWAQGLTTPMNPPRELGWYRRRKDRFFKEYNQLADEFGKLIGLDSWHLKVETAVFPEFEVDNEESRGKLSKESSRIFAAIEKEYLDHKVDAKPFVFIKNNAGTYGLGVISVHSADEVVSWSYKSRKKMKAAKGGRDISEVIIQEGIPTIMKGPDGGSAEPCIYMIGCQLAGGFLRTHGEKGPDDSLNSPGAVYKRLCVSDLKVRLEGCPMENAYGWIAKLAFLSVAREAKTLDVQFKKYIETENPCGM